MMSTALRPIPTSTPFSPEQERALAALTEGATITEAARAAGVPPLTLYLWARVHQPLHEALKNCRAAKVGLIRHQQEDLAGPALATMERLITDEKVPAAVQFKASQAILHLAMQPEAEWLMNAPKAAPPSNALTSRSASAPTAEAAPEAEEPSTEAILKELDDIEEGLDLNLGDEDEEDDEDYGPFTPEMLAEVDAFIAEWQEKLNQPEEPKSAADEAPEPIKTIRREGPKVGRNDPCPCDSGKKYKKCCGASVPVGQ